MSADLIARLIEAGTPAALVAEVAMALGRAAGDQVALTERRERDAARQRDKREKEKASRDITVHHGTSEDITDEAPAPDKRNPQTPKKINPTPCEGGARAREAEPVFSWAARLAAAQVAIATLVESLEQLIRKRWRGMPPPPGVTATQWKGFLDHRKSQRKSLTDHAYLLLCNRLEKHADPEWPPGRIIDTIIERGWLSFEKPWLTRITEQEHGKRTRHDRPSGWAAAPGFAGFEPASLDD